MSRFIGKKVIVRTHSAGVHYGEVVEHKVKEVTLKNAIRIWYWSGAASLSQLAKEGVTNPQESKFSVAVDEIYLSEAIEIIPCTEEACKNIEAVKTWKV